MGHRRTEDLRQIKSQAVGELGGLSRRGASQGASELLSKGATFV